MTAADGARVLVLHERGPALRADAQVPARHDHRVFGIIEAHEALLLPVVVLVFYFYFRLAFFDVVLLHHPVDGLQLEGQPLDQHQLLHDFHAVDLLLPVQREACVENHGVGLPRVLVVDRYDEGVVVAGGFLQLEPHHEVQVKVHGAPLVHPRLQSQFLHKPILAWRIKPKHTIRKESVVLHFGDVVHVLLFCDACVDPHVGIDLGVNLELEPQLFVVDQLRLERLFLHGRLDVKILQLLIALLLGLGLLLGLLLGLIEILLGP